MILKCIDKYTNREVECHLLSFCPNTDLLKDNQWFGLVRFYKNLIIGSFLTVKKKRIVIEPLHI